jgi:hypothetical protein
MNFNPMSIVIIDFLVKPEGFFPGIDLFDISGLPPVAALHLIKIAPSAFLKILPLSEFLFILLTGTHKLP